MHIVPVRFLRGLAALVLAGLVSACSGITGGEGPFSSTARMEGGQPSGQVGTYLRIAQEARDSGDITTARRFYETVLYVAPDTTAAIQGLVALGADRDRMTVGRPVPRIHIASNSLSNTETLAAEGMDGIAKHLADSVFPAAGDQAAETIPVVVAETHTSVEDAQKALQSAGEAALTQELAAIVPAAGGDIGITSPSSGMESEMPAGAAGDILPRITREHRAFLNERAKHAGIRLAARPTDAAGSVGKIRDPSSFGGLYRVQLAAYRSSRHAARGMDIFRRILGSMAVPLQVLERQSRNTSGKINFRIRTVGLASRNEAEELCRLVRTKGQDCLVIEHRAAAWRPIAWL